MAQSPAVECVQGGVKVHKASLTPVGLPIILKITKRADHLKDIVSPPLAKRYAPSIRGVVKNFYMGEPIRSIDIKNINHKSIEYKNFNFDIS